MDYNPQGERSVHIWLYFSDPRRKSDVQQLRTNDNIAAKEIERLQGLIEDLKQYRLEMADRAAYLLTAQPVRSAELKRRRDAWGKKIYYDFTEWDTFPDGTRQRVSRTTYDGADRHKAIADAKEYQKTHTGVKVAFEIAKPKWEH